MIKTNRSPIYGVVAEFESPDRLLEAAKEARRLGYRNIEAYTPYPVKELDKVIPGWDPMPAIVFVFGLLGAATAWTLQYYIAAIDYPINVGGRPLYSWPAFIPILFELTVLFAACSAFFGSLALCGLPRPHFPLFELPQFARASRDRFFLCVENHYSSLDTASVSEFLGRFEPIGVWEVDNT